MDQFLRFPCPQCGKDLKAPPSFFGKRVQCTRATCRVIFQMPGPVPPDVGLELDECEATNTLKPYGGRDEEPRDRKRGFPWTIAGVVAAIALICALPFGIYWWAGQPTSAHVATCEGYLRTGNELYDLHKPIATDAQAKEAEPKLVAKAEEHLEFRKQMDAIGGRKWKNLKERYESRIGDLHGKIAELLRSNRPIVVVTGASSNNAQMSQLIGFTQDETTGTSTSAGRTYSVMRMGSYNASDKPVASPPAPRPDATPPAPPIVDPAPSLNPTARIRALTGEWVGSDISLTIDESGSVKSIIGVNHGTQVTVCFNTNSIEVKGGELWLAISTTVAGSDLRFEFTFLPSDDPNSFKLKEKNNRIMPNPITMKRPSKGATPSPAGPKAKSDPVLVGSWNLNGSYRVYTGAEKNQIAVSREHTITIRGEIIEIIGNVNGNPTGAKFQLIVDPAASPKTYKFTGTDPEDYESGIYWVEKDTLLMHAEKLGKAARDFSFSGIALQEADRAGNDADIPKGFLRPRGSKGFSVLQFTRKTSKDPAPKAVPPAPSKDEPGSIAFSDLKIAKTSFEPPSVEFTIRLDLAGGEMLEAWASVGVKDAGKMLTTFAGAIDAGLLSVNGIDFANPDPSLKAQRVTMKKSAEDANVYECTVRYPKLILDAPETEFTIVAAVRKDKKIVKTNAATARVNLKTGAGLPPK